MKVVLFGATGMIGRGVLLECLEDPEVSAVLCVVRRSTGEKHPKLRELVHDDFTSFESIASELAGYDACLFCLGISSVGLSEAEYRRVTHDTAVAAADTLLLKNPGLTFVFVSGSGADGSERGRVMWARVKGETENAILRMPFKASYAVRPGFVQPRRGVTSRATNTRVFYSLIGPIYPALKLLFRNHVTTSDELGRAMLHLVKHGSPKRVLENSDMIELGREAALEPT